MDLSYFNARIRGLKGRLLDKKDYESFVAIETPLEYLDRLRSTPYGPYIETAEARTKDVDAIISGALKQDLVRTFSFLWKIAPDEARPLVKTLISVWEVYNLKAVIRGIVKGVRRDDIRAVLVPVGEFDSAALNELLASKDVGEVMRFLQTWGSPYAVPLKEGYAEFARHRNVIELELRLDHFVFDILVSNLREKSVDTLIIREMVETRIDVQNIMTLMKIVGEGYTRQGAESFFIEGGKRLQRELFLDLSALKTRDEVIVRLLEEIRDGEITGALKDADYEQIGLLEELFNEAVEKRLAKISIVEPLSIALAASYVHAKIREIKNLRILLRAKVFGIPREELRRFLIL